MQIYTLTYSLASADDVVEELIDNMCVEGMKDLHALAEVAENILQGELAPDFHDNAIYSQWYDAACKALHESLHESPFGQGDVDVMDFVIGYNGKVYATMHFFRIKFDA